ncbi:hypothetical protein GCM10011328_40490 [Hafnia psychrotolerans]|uniref:Uncharacterized protein n=2 Tax=Hafnia psychrotolerans TaxID=1477018 RepID=A0ABQ1H8P3_9GAMM|nr:hypothetical protein GCM10011328_40490 [Hafnia psychrotolerans]
MVGRSLDPEFQTCLSHTFSLEPEGVMKHKSSNGMIIMTEMNTEATYPENSVTAFRTLIAGLDLSHFTDPQLYDLGSVAAESAEGLCQGLLCLSEGLENSEILPPEGVVQVSAYLKASAHLLPALFELSEKTGIALGRNKAQP